VIARRRQRFNRVGEDAPEIDCALVERGGARFQGGEVAHLDEERRQSRAGLLGFLEQPPLLIAQGSRTVLQQHPDVPRDHGHRRAEFMDGQGEEPRPFGPVRSGESASGAFSNSGDPAVERRDKLVALE
jgi:hypothetical protein